MFTNKIINNDFTKLSSNPILDDVINGVVTDAVSPVLPDWWTNGDRYIVEGTTSSNCISYNSNQYISVAPDNPILGNPSFIILGQEMNIAPLKYNFSVLLASRSSNSLANMYKIYIDDYLVTEGEIPASNDNNDPLLVEVVTPPIRSANPTLNIVYNYISSNDTPLLTLTNINSNGLSERPLGDSYIPIDSIISTKQVKMVGFNDNVVRVLQVNSPEVEDDLKYKTQDIYRNVWLGGIFNSNEFNLLDQYNNTSDSDIVYGPLGNFKATIQCGDVAISIKPKTWHGVSYKVGDGFVEEQLAVIVHDKENMANGDYPNFTDLSDEEDPYAVLTGMDFDFMTKSPLTLNYYNFDTGEMWGNSFKLKNPYNLEWDVDAEISNDELNATLKDNRRYNKIGICDNKAWLSYKTCDSFTGDKVDYFNVTREEYKIGHNPQCFVERDITGDGVVPLPEDPLLYDMDLDKPYDDHFVPKALYGSDYMLYEHVESILPESRRLVSERSHKSNIYSIRITDSGLNERIVDLETRQTVQDSINTTIREMVKKAAPVDTQLWQIIWEGE